MISSDAAVAVGRLRVDCWMCTDPRFRSQCQHSPSEAAPLPDPRPALRRQDPSWN